MLNLFLVYQNVEIPLTTLCKLGMFAGVSNFSTRQ